MNFLKAITVDDITVTFAVEDIKFWVEGENNTSIVMVDYLYYQEQEELELKKTDEPMKLNLKLSVDDLESIIASLGGTIFDSSEFGNLKSVYFEGVNDRYLDISNATDSKTIIGTPFSCSFWVKLDSPVSFGTIFSNKSQTGSAPYVGCLINYPTVEPDGVYMAMSLTDVNNNNINRVTNDKMFFNQWYFVNCVYDGGNTINSIKIYIDSVEASSYTALASDTLNGPLDTGFSIATIGTYNNPTKSNPLKGFLDEFSIHYKEFTQQEITELYNSGVPIDLLSHSTSAFLNHWYRMGDGANDIFPNIVDVKNGAVGTLINKVSGDIVTDVPA